MHTQEGHLEDMTTLASVTTISTQRGYTENFRMEEEGLFAPSTEIHYLPNEVAIENFYRFEGASDPEDNAILYLLETHDGLKGMLVDSYGAEADKAISEFIKAIPEAPKAKSKD